MTWDQRREMTPHADLSALTSIDVYLAAYKPADLRAIKQRIDAVPRRCIQWSTAHDVDTAAVAMTG